MPQIRANNLGTPIIEQGAAVIDLNQLALSDQATFLKTDLRRARRAMLPQDYQALAKLQATAKRHLSEGQRASHLYIYKRAVDEFG